MSVVSENAGGDATTATPPPAPAPTDEIVISKSEFERLRKESEAFAAYRAKQQTEADAKEAQRVAAIAASNGTAKELAEIENRYKAKEATLENRVTSVTQRLHANLTRATLADATAGVTWTSPAAGKDALAKLSASFEVVTIGDGIEEVRERGTGRKAAEVVKQLLESSEFAHYQAAGQRGKGGLGAGNTAAETVVPTGQAWDEVTALANAVKAQKAQIKSAGLSEGWGFAKAPVKK